jgi:hypothetical protein
MGAAGGRYCVVTPYFREDRATLSRCIDSVRGLTVAADHILVADGHPKPWMDDAPVRHVTLDRPHADYGDFARGAGALMAVAEVYDGILFLDADNWFEPDHLETCLAAARQAPDCAFVAAQRKLIRPNGTRIPGRLEEQPQEDHVDTNCYLLLPSVYHLVHRWCTIPRELALIGDRLFYKALRQEGLPFAVAPRPTVNYLCLFREIYLLNGETPPPEAKPNVQPAHLQRWLDARSPEEHARIKQLTGLDLSHADLKKSYHA